MEKQIKTDDNIKNLSSHFRKAPPLEGSGEAVIQLIDSLEAGGAERMAVSYANALAKQGCTSFLWSTRKEGTLKESLHNKVSYTFLNRKGRIGIGALRKAIKLLKTNKIDVIHAHSTSFFFGTLLKLFYPKVKLIWHNHYGDSENLQSRNSRVLRYCSHYFDAVFVVNKYLEAWAIQNLKCDKVFYIKNFVDTPKEEKIDLLLKGTEGKRIVCLANLRKQKAHHFLIDAFIQVLQSAPDWSLHLLGKHWEDDYYDSVMSAIKDNGLEDRVFYYGSQQNVSALLAQSDIGVLSSISEGLPLALLEYALSGLPVVCTDVGFCKEVVQNNGKVVSPADADALAKSILFYIKNPQQRRIDALQLQQHVLNTYTEKSVLPEVISIYKVLITS